jgi:uncharacterized protein (DUF1499 family)
VQSRAAFCLSLLSAAACAGTAPLLGVHDGRLAPCPSSPNCVSSRSADARHRIEPLLLVGDVDAGWAALWEHVAGLPRTRVIEHRPLYLRAECRSALFGFVDDLELLLEPETARVQVRSASRTGHGDLGVNRRRVEDLRRALAARLRRPEPHPSR